MIIRAEPWRLAQMHLPTPIWRLVKAYLLDYRRYWRDKHQESVIQFTLARGGAAWLARPVNRTSHVLLDENPVGAGSHWPFDGPSFFIQRLSLWLPGRRAGPPLAGRKILTSYTNYEVDPFWEGYEVDTFWEGTTA